MKKFLKIPVDVSGLRFSSPDFSYSSTSPSTRGFKEISSSPGPPGTTETSSTPCGP